jgi:c-di-GMP-binding flagellar brake protein YcgR
MAASEIKNRRRSKRVCFINEVEVVEVGMHRSLDLSLGGLYIETVNSFPVDSVVTLRFSLGDADEQTISVSARVLYIHEGIGVGLAFVNLNIHDRERIEKFIDQNFQGE